MKPTVIMVGILAAIAGVGGIAAKGSVKVHPGRTTTGGQRADLVAVDPPLQPAKMTKDQALGAAKAAGLGDLLQHGSGMTFRYGSWYSGQAHVVAHGQIASYGPVDVWTITVGGLNLPGHGGVHGFSYPSDHFLTVFVDDKTGRVLLTRQYWSFPYG